MAEPATDRPYAAGLDVGTTKICTVIAAPAPDGTVEILGVGLTPSRGLKRGVVVDRQDAIESIKQSVAEAERMASAKISAVYVGLTGDHIDSRNVTGRVQVASGEIAATDVEKVVQSARDSVALPPDRQIIHSIVRDYGVDGQHGVKRPLGMSGNVLDVELHVVTGMASVIENLERCVREAGMEVQQRALEPLATSAAVLTEAERNLGVVLVDIGGGTSDVAVFRDGAIYHTSAVPLGGEAMTRDLAQLLRISLEDAEDAKRKFGYATPELVAGDEMVQIRLVGSGDSQRVPRRLLAEIIQPRIEEIFGLIREDLRGARALEPTVTGVVLSGGGSQLDGTTHMASIVLDGMPVRVGAPRNLSGLAESVNNPMYATGVGLAIMACQEEAYAMPTPVVAGSGPASILLRWWYQAIIPRVRRYLEGH